MSPEYVAMPVPVDRVQEVYELLARPSGAPVGGEVGALPLPWSDELLLRAYDESSAAMRSILDALAERPGQTVSAAELAGMVGLGRREIPGVLGAFARRWANRYHQGPANLPFKSYRSTTAKMTVYKMDEVVAAALTRALGAPR